MSRAECGVERNYNRKEEGSCLECWYRRGVMWEALKEEVGSGETQV